MFKSDIFRDSDTPSRDSESESTPLLSSGSRTSLEATILFDDSEISELDESPGGQSLKYNILQLHQFKHRYFIGDVKSLTYLDCILSIGMEASTLPVTAQP